MEKRIYSLCILIGFLGGVIEILSVFLNLGGLQQYFEIIYFGTEIIILQIILYKINSSELKTTILSWCSLLLSALIFYLYSIYDSLFCITENYLQVFFIGLISLIYCFIVSKIISHYYKTRTK